ncbi:MAG: hypothetical protein LBT84_07245 [Spirochaetia bacterium]|jgi:hypothetical protein|nr:hypothetical protein [Spirochaetia bacterium]
MARKMCPVSKKICTDCALYIGRHYFTCLSEDAVSKKVVDTLKKNKLEYIEAHDDGMFGLSEFDNAPKTGSWYHNIEDIYIIGQG